MQKQCIKCFWNNNCSFQRTKKVEKNCKFKITIKELIKRGQYEKGKNS